MDASSHRLEVTPYYPYPELEGTWRHPGAIAL